LPVVGFVVGGTFEDGMAEEGRETHCDVGERGGRRGFGEVRVGCGLCEGLGRWVGGWMEGGAEVDGGGLDGDEDEVMYRTDAGEKESS
jgi:hypothetical protein